MSNLKLIIPIIIIIIIITAAIITLVTNEESSENKVEEKWVRSGPFEIDKEQYNIGEKVFLTTRDLLPEEKGAVHFLRPTNDTHYESYIKIPFNGMAKSQFNYYFEPRLSEFTQICSINDLTGNWIVVFYGTKYQDINFEILPQTSSWDERPFEPVC